VPFCVIEDLPSTLSFESSLSRTWIPKDCVTPASCIFLAHGVNEHIGRYCDLAHSLTAKGHKGKVVCGLGLKAASDMLE